MIYGFIYLHFYSMHYNLNALKTKIIISSICIYYNSGRLTKCQIFNWKLLKRYVTFIESFQPISCHLHTPPTALPQLLKFGMSINFHSVHEGR